MKIRVSWKTQLPHFIIFNRFDDGLPEFALQVVHAALRGEKKKKSYGFQALHHLPKTPANLRT